MVKFLIIRFSSIGDIVLTTPVVRYLKKQVDGAQIHFLTKKSFAEIVKSNPYIHKVHTLENNLSLLLEELKKESFDYIIDLHNNLRSFRAKQSLRRVSFTFKKLNIQKWLLVNFKINTLPDVHIVDRYLDTIRLFDIHDDNEGLDYFIPPQEETNMLDLPVAFHQGYIAFVTGAKHYTKQLPHEKLCSLLTKIEYPVVLLGGHEDEVKASQITRVCGNKNVYNACGKYSLNGSASLIRQSCLVITPDTGLMHIAAAFRKKIISLWGNTVPEFGMYPYMPGIDHELIEVKNIRCRPCSKIGFDRCPRKHFRCMNDLDEKKILDAVKKFLK